MRKGSQQYPRWLSEEFAVSNHGKDANLDETHIHNDDDDACAEKVDEGLKGLKKINDDTGSVKSGGFTVRSPTDSKPNLYINFKIQFLIHRRKDQLEHTNTKKDKWGSYYL